MRTFIDCVVRFVQEEDGPTAVEYAVMLASIVLVCFVAITAVGTNVNKTFSNASLQAAAS